MALCKCDPHPTKKKLKNEKPPFFHAAFPCDKAAFRIKINGLNATKRE